MNEFVFSYPTKIYFGEKAAQKHLQGELEKVGEVVMLAYGGGSIKKNGIYEEKKIKAGVFGAHADFAILDPAYTLTVPFKQVISGAFDTLSHAMETYFGKPQEITISDEISEAVMRNTIRNMRLLLEKPDDLAVRSELMWDSAMAENGILKIGKITDFQAHQIEHQIGAYTDCNHGQMKRWHTQEWKPWQTLSKR